MPIATPACTNSNPFPGDTFIAIKSTGSDSTRSFPSLILMDVEDLRPSSAVAFDFVVGWD